MKKRLGVSARLFLLERSVNRLFKKLKELAAWQPKLLQALNSMCSGAFFLCLVRTATFYSGHYAPGGVCKHIQLSLARLLLLRCFVFPECL